MEVIHNFWVIQVIGLIGLLFAIFAWNSKERVKVLNLQSASIALFIVHYILLGAYAGAASNAVGLIRNLVFVQKGIKKWATHTVWMYVFIALSGSVLIFFWQGWPSILPVIGISLGTFALFRDDPKQIRFYMFLTGLVWIPYTIIVQSYSGLLTQTISTLGLLVAMFRLDRNKSN